MTKSIVKGAVAYGVAFSLCIHVVLMLFGAPLVAAHSWAIPPIVAVIVLMDQRVCRETIFLANIGIRASVAPIAAGVTALLLEVALYSVAA